MRTTVIALGHVDTVAATCLAGSGHKVTGERTDADRVGHLPMYAHDPWQMTPSAVAAVRLQFLNLDEFDGGSRG